MVVVGIILLREAELGLLEIPLGWESDGRVMVAPLEELSASPDSFHDILQ